MRAVRMAAAMRERTDEFAKGWRSRGHELGFGVGIAMGYATLGKIGSGEQYSYGAIGTVTNLASRLCDEAQPGQILISQRVYAAVEAIADAEAIGEIELKGIPKPARVYNMRGLRETGPVPGKPPGGLSRREEDVAALVAQGLSNRVIGEMLFIGERTVESHVQSILNKLAFHTRAQIAAWAVAHGLPGTSRKDDRPGSPAR